VYNGDNDSIEVQTYLRALLDVFASWFAAFVCRGE